MRIDVLYRTLAFMTRETEYKGLNNNCLNIIL